MMKKVFEEMALYNENKMLGAERVFKYKKIKVKVGCLSGTNNYKVNRYKVPNRGINNYLEYLLYGEFGYKSNEYGPYI